jgi:hypothetical protein
MKSTKMATALDIAVAPMSTSMKVPDKQKKKHTVFRRPGHRDKYLAGNERTRMLWLKKTYTHLSGKLRDKKKAAARGQRDEIKQKSGTDAPMKSNNHAARNSPGSSPLFATTFPT